MDINLTNTAARYTSGQDRAMAFIVPSLNVRGRIVRLDSTLNEIIRGHNYAGATARILAESLVITALLGSALKTGSRFILQTSSDGDIATLVSDYRNNPDERGANLRGYARLSVEAQALQKQELDFGHGTLAFTIDLGAHAQRYQGIVALEHKTLTQAALAYFEQSEQIPSFLKVSVAEEMHKSEAGELVTALKASGVLLQHMPDDEAHKGETPEKVVEVNVSQPEPSNSWEEASIRMQTIEDKELLDEDLAIDQLIHRLFHDYGYEVYSGISLHARCSCSEDRIKEVISGFSATEREEIRQQNIHDNRDPETAVVVCEFCSKQYDIPLNEQKQEGKS